MMNPDERSSRTEPTGEARLKQRERRILAIKGGLFVAGLLSGLIAGYLVGENGFDPAARWPATLSVSLAVTYLAAMAAGTVLLHQLYDEVERRIQDKAVAAAGLFYALSYPVWFVLWKGGLLPEPSHWQLFLGFYVALAGSYLFYRFR